MLIIATVFMVAMMTVAFSLYIYRIYRTLC